jgi:Tfp pilus assembly PilM family ATPase
MSTLTARAGSRGIRLPWGRASSSAVGVEAGESGLRLAQRRFRGQVEDWSLCSLALRTEDLKDSAKANLCLKGQARKARAPKGAAVCAISSPSVDIFPLNIKLAEDESIDSMVVSHARKLLSAPLEDVVLDYMPLPDWVRRPGEETVTVLVFSAPRVRIEQILDSSDRLGIRVNRILTPGCVIAQQAARCGTDKRYLLIATGEEATSVSVSQGGYVLLERILPWSVNKLAGRIENVAGIDAQKARSLLTGTNAAEHGAGVLSPRPADALLTEESLRQFLAPSFRELTEEATGCLGYCGSFLKHASTAAAILTGPLAANAHLADTLQAELGLPVLGAKDGLGLEGLEGSEGGAEFATAACCALWTEGESR